MTISKFTNKSLVLDQDLEYSQKIGLPVEVYCMKQYETVAFGQIQLFTHQYVQINDRLFCRDGNAFFGCPCPM
ncbi:hypothetical protein [Pseudalkalibacillus berkeleyi]|uniref:Uncharacterized protein n=1 Tax=Pseudalkalibacillus berkeleyi TaxID=1069813 RepID=A0ABS9GXW5_9BACL|nr:hypothetical protein [Pseudalkalibacillus berkeleyi]MCF6137607.1 hypothetical protein [Pseudalkalibacillus berkeleyi]